MAGTLFFNFFLFSRVVISGSAGDVIPSIYQEKGEFRVCVRGGGRRRRRGMEGWGPGEREKFHKKKKEVRDEGPRSRL